jgi:phospholipid/cholesterol/gamma-HCH transport system ATP-binding protein
MTNQSTPETPVPLVVEGLKAGYQDKVILEDVSFLVAPKEIRAILGRSGCGKSTLLNHILGLDQAKKGSVAYFGTRLQMDKDPIPLDIRQRCGVLFQNGALLSSLSLSANVALPLHMHRPDLPLKVIEEIVAQKLESVSMLAAWYKYPAELSGGMRKRAALARALVLDPSLLFCDEPTSGLDPVTAKALDDLLLHLRTQFGIAIVLVTHDLESIRNIADKVLFLADGKVLFDGTLQDAQKSAEPEIAEFFSHKSAPPSAQQNLVSFTLQEENHGNHQS